MSTRGGSDRAAVVMAAVEPIGAFPSFFCMLVRARRRTQISSRCSTSSGLDPVGIRRLGCVPTSSIPHTTCVPSRFRCCGQRFFHGRSAVARLAWRPRSGPDHGPARADRSVPPASPDGAVPAAGENRRRPIRSLLFRWGRIVLDGSRSHVLGQRIRQHRSAAVLAADLQQRQHQPVDGSRLVMPGPTTG